MAEIVLKNVPNEVIEALRTRAQFFGHSLTEEIFAILHNSSNNPMLQFANQASICKRELRDSSRSFTYQGWRLTHD